MRKIVEVRPRTRERVTVMATLAYIAALLTIASVVQWGGLTGDTRLGVVAVTMPTACIGALILMRRWREWDR